MVTMMTGDLYFIEHEFLTKDSVWTTMAKWWPLGSTFHLGRAKFHSLPESHIANAKISWVAWNSCTLQKALTVSQTWFWCASMLSVKAPGASNILAKAYQNPPRECCQMIWNLKCFAFFFFDWVAVFVVALWYVLKLLFVKICSPFKQLCYSPFLS